MQSMKGLGAALTVIAWSMVAVGDGAKSVESFDLVTLEGTTPVDVVRVPTEYRGRRGLLVRVSPDHEKCPGSEDGNCTFLNVATQSFRDGVIELELAGKPTDGAPEWARGFVGVVFRVNVDHTRFEGMYLRPTNSHADDQLQRNHTTQYFSYPDYPWHRLRKESPGKYESWADMETGEWIDVRIEVEGVRARLFLNGNDNPVLVVNDLKLGAEASGTVGLFTAPATDAYFRNLRITHH